MAAESSVARTVATRPLVAVQIGTLGFVAFAKGLERLGVIDREELLGLLRLHSAIVRATEEPLDDGERFDEETFSRLQVLLGDGGA